MLSSQLPLEASLILGSTGSAKGSVTPVFDIEVKMDPGHPTPSSPAAPLRYGKLGEIHHIFGADPKNPPKIVSLVFALAVLATVPSLFIGVSKPPSFFSSYNSNDGWSNIWASIPGVLLMDHQWTVLGGNLSHASKAMGKAPLSHALFFGSIVAMEGVFFLYYSAWNLFQTLPVMGLVATVAFFSGTRALGEVQGRRLAGER